MSKIKINSTLKTESEIKKTECIGIKIDNKIKFLDNNIKTIIQIFTDNISITRTTNEYRLELQFKKFLTITGIYDIKSIGVIEVETETKILEIESNKIHIEYNLYNNKENLGKYIYIMEFEEI